VRTDGKHIVWQITALFFSVAILFQNGVEAPVICFESDGQINLEAKCDSSCEVPVKQTDEHQDDCNNCFDIQLWNYNPDLVFLAQNTENDVDLIDIIHIHQYFELVPEFIYHHKNDINIQQIPPFIKTTILLI